MSFVAVVGRRKSTDDQEVINDQAPSRVIALVGKRKKINWTTKLIIGDGEDYQLNAHKWRKKRVHWTIMLVKSICY